MAQVIDLISISLTGSPVGTLYFSASDTIPASNLLLCDGRDISRTFYSDLFAIIGVDYGVGDGVTTFNIPDFRGEFFRGFDDTGLIDPGRVFEAPQGQSTRLPRNSPLTGVSPSAGNHSHTTTINSGGSHSHRLPSGEAKDGVWLESNPHPIRTAYTNYAGNHNHSVSLASNGNHSHTCTINSGGDAETRPDNIAFDCYLRF